MKKLLYVLLILFLLGCEEKVHIETIEQDKNEKYLEDFKGILPFIKGSSVLTKNLVFESNFSLHSDYAILSLLRNCPISTHVSDPFSFELDYGVDCIVNNDTISGICLLTADGLFGEADGFITTDATFEINNIGLPNTSIELFYDSEVPSGSDNHIIYSIGESFFNIVDGGFSFTLELDAAGFLTYVDSSVDGLGTDPSNTTADYQLISETGLVTMTDGTQYLVDIQNLQVSEAVCGDYCPYGGSIEVSDDAGTLLYTANFSAPCGSQIEIVFADGSPTQLIDCNL